jgi:4-amino-4-deoxy-L-arabinose transferase-like glycosyltransferase
VDDVAGWLQQAFRKYHLVLLALVLLLAAWLRLYHLAYNVPSLSQDEVVNGYDAYSLGHTLRDHHGILLPRTLGSFGDSASVALTYLTIPFVVLGGLTEQMVRLPIALTGIASVGLIYLLLREAGKNRNLALLGAFILAIAPWNITLTRWAIPPSIVPFFLLLFLWLFAVAVNRNRSRKLALALAGLAAALLSYAYPSAEILAPFIVVTAGLLYLWRRKRDLALMLGVYAIAVLPLFYLLIFKSSSNFARYNAVKLQGTGLDLVREAASHYAGYFSYHFYFGARGNDPAMHVPGVGNFYSFMALILATAVGIIIYKLVRRGSRKAWIAKLRSAAVLRPTALIAVALLLGPVPASLSIDKQHVTRAIFMFPFVTLILTLAAYFVLTRFKTGWQRLGATVVFIAVSLFAVCNYMHIYTGPAYREQAAVSFQYGVKQGVDYLAAHQAGYRAVVMDRNINQPYIYYLFYSRYDPKRLDYAQINSSELEHRSFAVVQVGNYFFTPLTDQDVRGATYLTSVRGYGHTWYDIYRRGHDELIMKLH